MTFITTLTGMILDVKVTIEVYDGVVRAYFRIGNTTYDGGSFSDIDGAFWWMFNKIYDLTRKP